MNLDLLRSIGMTEEGFNSIASMLKADALTLDQMSFALNHPPSFVLCVSTVVAKEMTDSPLEEAAPNLFASAQSFINERKDRLRSLPERHRILKHLDSVLSDLSALEGERGQSRYAHAYS